MIEVKNVSRALMCLEGIAAAKDIKFGSYMDVYERYNLSVFNLHRKVCEALSI